METRFLSIFLNTRNWMLIPLILGCQLALAQQSDDSVPPTIDPPVERRDIRESDIDTEDFEVSAFVGVISIEDFGQDTLTGARLAYHIIENVFVEATYGQAEAGQTSFEVLSGGAPFLTDEERDYQFYDVSLAYNINGELFLTDQLVFNSDLYLSLGGGSTDFAGDERFTISIGGGYRVLLTDYMSLRLDVKDYIFSSELIGEEKDTHNLSYTLGVSFYF